MSATTGNDVLSGTNGNDVIDLLAGNDSALGLDGNDSILGNDGTDTIDGGNGDDTIAGGTGDDRLIGGNGADRLDGGAGSLDYVDYSANGVGQNVSINFVEGRALDGLGFTDTLLGIEYIRAGAGADTMVGGNANDRFRGNAGNDSIDGGNGSEDILDLAQTTRPVSASLVTGIANDGLDGTDRFTNVEVVYSGTASDTLLGGDRDEIFDGGMGGDLIDGGLGADRVRYYLVSGNNSSITRGVSVDLAAQRATDGWGGVDTLVGIERVTATNFADTLLGDNVSNRFNGFAGNDTIDGGLSSDWLEYTDGAATSGVTVNLTTGTASDGRGGTDSFTSIEHAIGGTFGDHLTGTAQLGRSTSRLRGAAGSDTLVGIDGEFVVADYTDQTVGLSVNLASGSVNDGLGGVDSLVNIRGAIMYRDYADTLIGSNGTNWLSPSGGNDSIVGGSGTDMLVYDGNPTGGVSVNLTSRTASDGDGGTDFFTGIEAVMTGYSNDTVIGDNGHNFISLGAGADSADAAGGRDVISYAVGFSRNTSVYVFNEAGNQAPFTGVTIDLAAGRATDYGGSVDTILNFEDAEGSSMHDSILGSSGDNDLDGREGNDTINGGAGNDTIRSDAGNELFMGDAGNDLYLMAAATGRVIIDDASGNDTVSFGGVSGREVLASEISSVAGIEAYDLANGGNILHLTAARALSVSGTGLFRVFGSGADRLIFDDTGWVRTGSSGGFDTMSNSAGNATVIASTGLVSSDIGSVVNGGEGNDTLGGGNGADTIDGGNGADLLAGLGGSDSILGGLGNDMMLGGNGNDNLSGGDGNDTLSGDAGNDWISGNTGNDRLQGGAGSDSIDAGSGNDTLWGNLGQDTYVGGVGADLFALTHQENFSSGDAGSSVSAQDVVQDFNRLEGDRLDLFGGLYQDVSGTNRTLAWYGTIGDANAVASLSAGVALPDGASSDQVRAYWLPRIGGDGWLALDLNRDGNLNTSDFAVFVNTSDNAALVVNDFATGTFVAGSVNNNDTINGAGGAETFDGGVGNDLLNGLAGNDSLIGGSGDDSLSGGDGNDTLSGDAGNDVAIYSDARTAHRFSLDNGALIVTGPTGTDRLQGIESLRFGSDAPLEVASLGSMNLVEQMVAVSRGGVTTAVLPERYSGPVKWLEYQMLGIDGGDVMIGTSRNDFFNLLGGDDAANGGDGDDVLDGGSGSNFLTGGAGRDDFFLDGRGGTITWATITDWQANERLSVWGWRPGVSTAQWVDSAGATGYTGVTMHGDLDGNGGIDTSVTWTGMTAGQLPTPLEYEGLLWFT
ncbi:MAG: hypothetical protein INF95_08115 [Roseomonas sp.]|nr:hypothetical protein [Roseomonas sp.]MCA3316998.1 hypothetical protein [Roseomonas sp.]MCA3319586.1 hypothetical protein [Roseomonas sp.]